MMRPLVVTASLLALFVLAACSGRKAEDSGQTASAPSTAARQKTVIDDQLKALDKAKALEKQMQEDKEKSDRAIEDAGG